MKLQAALMIVFAASAYQAVVLGVDPTGNYTQFPRLFLVLAMIGNDSPITLFLFFSILIIFIFLVG